MSNIGNIFGNEGWIQSSIDKSRGKSRPGEKRRAMAKSDRRKRKKALQSDPLVKKAGRTGLLDLKFSWKPPKVAKPRSLLSRMSSLKNDPLVQKYGG